MINIIRSVVIATLFIATQSLAQTMTLAPIERIGLDQLKPTMTIPAYSAQGTLAMRHGFYVLKTENKTLVVAAPNMPLSQMRQLDACVQMRCQLQVHGRLLIFKNEAGFDRGRTMRLTLIEPRDGIGRASYDDPIERIARSASRY